MIVSLVGMQDRLVALSRDGSIWLWSNGEWAEIPPPPIRPLPRKITDQEAFSLIEAAAPNNRIRNVMRNAVRKLGIETLSELLSLTRKDWLEIKGCGEDSAAEIAEILKPYRESEGIK